VKNKVLATAAIGVAILVGAITLAATGIVGPASASTPTAESMITQPEGGNGWFHRWREHRREVRQHVVQLTADTIGISPDTLKSELKSGKTITQVATDNNADPASVATAITNDVDGRVDQAVANGKLKQEKADAIEARVPDVVNKVMNHVFGS
jgi:hypothetical protein